MGSQWEATQVQNRIYSPSITMQQHFPAPKANSAFVMAALQAEAPASPGEAPQGRCSPAPLRPSPYFNTSPVCTPSLPKVLFYLKD